MDFPAGWASTAIGVTSSMNAKRSIAAIIGPGAPAHNPDIDALPIGMRTRFARAGASVVRLVAPGTTGGGDDGVPTARQNGVSCLRGRLWHRAAPSRP